MDFVHLVCVTSVNNNKYYDMRDCGDGTFEVTYGRIGATKATAIYPISKWDTIYRQKLNKGYEDMTNMVATKEVIAVEKYKPIEDKRIASLIEYLREKARDTIKKNYTVGSDIGSPAMISAAQAILDRLSLMDFSVREFNDKLLELFTVIPRRMTDVSCFLAANKDEFEKIIHREQELLDVMAGQVSSGNTVEVKESGNENQTILEAYGLEFSPATDNDIEIIKKQLGKECENLFYKAWRVENLATRKKFKAFCKGKGRITKKLFWHGSRTENWWSILRSGLVLRPTNAVINGKMFGCQ